jgi:GT2 family glycosyltransferase
MGPSPRVMPSFTQTTLAIVVPSLDQGGFLGAALASVFSQTGVDLKVAVVDAGSRDNSLEIIRRYQDRVSYWRSRPDSGQAAAINEGIGRLPATDYVGWLNADDLLLAGGLARMAGFLDAHPECVAVYGRAHIIDGAGRVIGEFPTRPFRRRRLSRTSIICQPASLIRAQTWRRVGGLDESLDVCLDYDLWLRVSRCGRIGYLDDFVACSRDHPGTKSRTRKARLYEEAFRILQRDLGYVPWRWCESEAAWAWREAHGGVRAASMVSQSACAWRALLRYFRVNGVQGLIRPLRGT